MQSFQHSIKHKLNSKIVRTLIVIFLTFSLNKVYSQNFTFEVASSGFANNIILEEYMPSIDFPITTVSTRHETDPTFSFSVDTRFIYGLGEKLNFGINLGYSRIKINYLLNEFYNENLGKFPLNSIYSADNINILGLTRYSFTEKFHAELYGGTMYVFNSSSSNNFVLSNEKLPFYEEVEEENNYYLPFTKVNFLYSLTKKIKLELSYGQQLRKTKFQISGLGGHVFQTGLGVSYTIR